MSNPSLRLCDITHYMESSDGKNRPIIVCANAEFAQGTITCITGKEGSGKSTLLHLLSGLLRPTEGQILAGGEPISRWTAGHRDRWRRTVGIMLQNTTLINATVFENVILPLLPRPLAHEERVNATYAALSTTGIEDLSHKSVYSLSGGERQRVALARATVHQPQYLLLDEPTAHQDESGVQCLLSILETAIKRGAAVVLASHDPRLIRELPSQNQFVLKNGTLSKIEP